MVCFAGGWTAARFYDDDYDDHCNDDDGDDYCNDDDDDVGCVWYVLQVGGWRLGSMMMNMMIIAMRMMVMIIAMMMMMMLVVFGMFCRWVDGG